MNVPFVFTNNEITDKVFLDFCLSKGLTTLKGHRSVGGFRASIYNAMPKSGPKKSSGMKYPNYQISNNEL